MAPRPKPFTLDFKDAANLPALFENVDFMLQQLYEDTAAISDVADAAGGGGSGSGVVGVDVEAWSAALDALAALATLGIMVRSAANTFITRTITAGAGISVANGDGIAGNPTITATAAVVVPDALTKGDDTNVTLTLGGTPATALLKATSITAGWAGSLAVARGGTGSTTAINARTALGVAVGSDVQAWDADLDAVAALAATAGFLSRTGAGAFAARTLVAGSGVTISNPTGAAGDPTISADSAIGYPLVKILKITDAQFKALLATPITLIAAPAANLIIVPLVVGIWKSWLGGIYSGTRTLGLAYANNTAVPLTSMTLFANTQQKQFQHTPISAVAQTDATDVTAQAVRIWSTNPDLTGGNAANFVTFFCVYSLFDTTLG